MQAGRWWRLSILGAVLLLAACAPLDSLPQPPGANGAAYLVDPGTPTPTPSATPEH